MIVLWRGARSKDKEVPFFAMVSNVSCVHCSGCAVGQECPLQVFLSLLNVTRRIRLAGYMSLTLRGLAWERYWQWHLSPFPYRISFHWLISHRSVRHVTA